MSFTKGFEKCAIKGLKPEALDRLGLKMLMLPGGYAVYKGIKEKQPAEAAMGVAELGGLGLLHHAVTKGMKVAKR